MQHYRNDHYESEPLDSQNYYESSPRHPNQQPQNHYGPPSPTPYYDAPSPVRSNHPAAHPDSAYNRMQPVQDNYSQGRSASPYSGGSAGYDSPRRPSPSHHDQGYYNQGGGAAPAAAAGGAGYMGYAHPNANTTPGADNFGQSASGGMAGIAWDVADRNPRNSGMDAMQHTGLPPPPSRSQQNPYDSNGGYGYDSSYDNGAHGPSQSSLAGLAPGGPPGSGSTSHFNGSDPYVNNPYPPGGYYANSSRGSANLGVVNPNEIVDDGDDGLTYGKSQRNSMLSLSHSDRGKKIPVASAAAVGGGAAAAGLMGSRGGSGGGGGYEMNAGHEKPSDWLENENKRGKKWKWIIIVGVFLVIVGAIVGGVVGGVVNNGNHESKSGSSSGGKGQSAEEDEKKNGDLGKSSAEIQKLLNNPDLHRVFPGIDYTPLNSQYPDCMHNPPSQNNITRDVAVLGQLTNKIRLYGTDCNQTQMLLHAIDRLELTDTKVWLGVWLDKNETTNDRQLDQMWDILDEYGDDPFEGIIIANEILFREEMTITSLAKILDDTRTQLKKKNLNLPVATSDLGDDWTDELAKDSDYIMANIHPFFAGVTAEEAAAWTYNFWEVRDGPYWKSDKQKNIISETGWPTAGGKTCGQATTCTEGSVAGIDELNTFMDNWVCQALKNGTNYFWFEAFDEPWKIKFNEKGKEWEDKWGLMTVNRELKDGVKIPDCGGKTIKDYKDFSS